MFILLYIGHPLCGDDLYGGQIERISRQKPWIVAKQHLLDPITGALFEIFHDKLAVDFL